ncbi:Oxysterol-binding protein-related protein like [Quillaja saponaria]|uniref:Oxysterol-binding protein-related protein like n=1 Tax=Quillaja saponaria TaxID=32244 RepID=A0AAD7P7Z4_QUISA|nr:Oxysterol-binding protein-related protein like [Quillaja saponaria]
MRASTMTSVRSLSTSSHKRESSSQPSSNRHQRRSSIQTSKDQHYRLFQRSASAVLGSRQPSNRDNQPVLADHREVVINDIVGSGISGILYKWVNYGRGWRPRWFVLQDGVLSYYKIHGHNKIVLNQEVERGSMIIGEESLRLIKTHRHSQSRNRKAVGEIHLMVCSIRESKSDEKKFSIYTGTKNRLHLRAESREDRAAWLEALHAVKDMFPRSSNAELMAPAETVVISTEKLRKRLLEEGVSEAAIQESEYIMRSELSELHKHFVVLKHKQLLLMDTLRNLETEKVDLENTVVDESQRQAKEEGSSFRSMQGKDSEGSGSDSYDEHDRHDGAEEESDNDGNAFVDTRDYLSTSSFRSNGSDFHRLSLESDDEETIDCEDGMYATIRSVGSNYPHIRRRKKLPDPVEKEKGVSLWSMIKDNIGKDLTKVCLPVYFNEPISSLQKCFEDLKYSYLIDQAYECGKMGDSLKRILHVAAFAVSGYACTEGRNCKPFNPLLGETYEADYPDKGLRFISEKVSHHPMVVACHCEGRGWKFWGDSNLKSKFWGRSIQLDPVGVLTLEFDDGEIFQWSKVTTSIYNLILGKLYCDHYGTMRIDGNHGYSCKIKFKEQSILDRNPHQVQGIIQDKKGKTVATLFGKWDESLYYVTGDSKEQGSKPCLLWKRSKPSNYQTRYNFSRFAITLNEITPGLEEKLPPTDSRLRPDQRCLENGEYEMANSEKLRLEQRQRQARKMQEKGWKPRWFAKDKGSDTYRYVGGYWETREKGNWAACPNIFGEVPTDTNSD